VKDNNGCSSTATVTISQPAALAVNLTGPSSDCSGQPVNVCAAVAGGTGAYTYAWAPTGGSTSCATVYPIISSTYTVNITDSNRCTTSGTIFILVGPALNVTVSGSSMCPGGTTTLCASATGGTGGNTFLWQPGNISGPCITVSPLVTTIYTITVTDNCGSNASSISRVIINPLPNIAFSADVYQGCTPLCIQFRNLTTGNNANWYWTFGNGDWANSESPIYCYADSGHYNVSLTVTSDSGCSSTLQIGNMIIAYAHPHAAYRYSVVSGRTIQFTDQSTDKYGIVYWNWNFMDDSTSTLQNPLETYPWGAYYCPTLMVMNMHGCVDTVTNCLTVASVPDIISEIGDLNIYPNPSNGVFELEYSIKSGQSSALHINIINELGEVVYTKKKQTITGINREQFNLGNLASGIYTLRIQTDNNTVVKKLVIVRNK
jgi:PKD repeat protein